MRLWLASGVATLALACGGESTQTGNGSNGGTTSTGGTSGAGDTTGSGGAGNDTGAGASGGSSTSGGTGATSSGGASGFECPAAIPDDGDPCIPPPFGSGFGFDLAHCSWGDDPRPIRRTLATCTSDQWTVTTPTDVSCDDPPLPASCPDSAPTSGTECSDETLRCTYDDGMRCDCSACSGGSEYPLCQTIDPPEWACHEPASGCPNPPPQAGEACDQPDLECGLDCELTVTCTDDLWHYGGGNCPICASPDTPIATPAGDRNIAELHAGDLVYSVDDTGVVVVPIRLTGSTPVFHHRVVRLELDDGGILEISPGHPTADGRLFSSLVSGSLLDERHVVVNARLVDYEHDRTYDILPDSSSGAYFAAGALVGSTLRRE